jgi:hypothetical protein
VSLNVVQPTDPVPGTIDEDAMQGRPKMRRDRKREIRFHLDKGTKLALSRAIVVVALLFAFINMPQGAASDILVVLGFAVVGLVSIVFMVVKYKDPARSSPNIYVELIYYLTVFIAMFSVLYWNYGSRSNFNIQLTHWDAVYFTIGTLSTAGTGNIVATSEVTREIQGLQMLLDLGFLLVAVTLVINRFASLKSESK